MRIKYFTVTLLGILVYTFSVEILAIDGFSIVKIAYTAIAWLVIIISAKYFIKRFNIIKKKYGKVVTYLFVGLICWNISLIIRSLFIDPSDAITILGNEETALALLVPLVIGFSTDKTNISLLFSYVFRYLILLSCLIGVFFLTNSIQHYAIAITILFAPLYFLIPINLYQDKWKKTIIHSCSILLLVIAIYYSESRTTVLRIILLYTMLLAGNYFAFYKKKIAYKTYLIVLIVPIIGIYISIANQESIIKYGLDKISNDEISTDTRTFMYIELYNDLNENNELLYGKGASGRYYSPYFAQVERGDYYYRLTVEVGWLWLLLRGGFISVLFYAGLILTTIYKAFHDSNNQFIKALGWFLTIHFLLSFLENIVYMDMYNYLLWITIGIVLNRDIRYLNDGQIKKYLPI